MKTSATTGTEGARTAISPTAPVKVRRRPGFLIGSVAALLLGALGAVWLWTATTSTTEVLAVRSTIQRGAVITAADLATVRIGVDPALQAVPAGEAPAVVGKRAALDIAAGGLVTRADLAEVLVPATGQTVVGLALGAGFLPAVPLQTGDRVRVVQVPAVAQAEPGPPVTVDATVVAVGRTSDGQAALVDVSVAVDAAPGLAAAAASGKVALLLESRTR